MVMSRYLYYVFRKFATMYQKNSKFLLASSDMKIMQDNVFLQVVVFYVYLSLYINNATYLFYSIANPTEITTHDAPPQQRGNYRQMRPHRMQWVGHDTVDNDGYTTTYYVHTTIHSNDTSKLRHYATTALPFQMNQISRNRDQITWRIRFENPISYANPHEFELFLYEVHSHPVFPIIVQESFCTTPKVLHIWLKGDMHFEPKRAISNTVFESKNFSLKQMNAMLPVLSNITASDPMKCEQSKGQTVYLFRINHEYNASWYSALIIERRDYIQMESYTVDVVYDARSDLYYIICDDRHNTEFMSKSIIFYGHSQKDNIVIRSDPINLISYPRDVNILQIMPAKVMHKSIFPEWRDINVANRLLKLTDVDEHHAFYTITSKLQVFTAWINGDVTQIHSNQIKIRHDTDRTQAVVILLMSNGTQRSQLIVRKTLSPNDYGIHQYLIQKRDESDNQSTASLIWHGLRRPSSTSILQTLNAVVEATTNEMIHLNTLHYDVTRFDPFSLDFKPDMTKYMQQKSFLDTLSIAGVHADLYKCEFTIKNAPHSLFNATQMKYVIFEQNNVDNRYIWWPESSQCEQSHCEIMFFGKREEWTYKIVVFGVNYDNLIVAASKPFTVELKRKNLATCLMSMSPKQALIWKGQPKAWPRPHSYTQWFTFYSPQSLNITVDYDTFVLDWLYESYTRDVAGDVTYRIKFVAAFDIHLLVNQYRNVYYLLGYKSIDNDSWNILTGRHDIYRACQEGSVLFKPTDHSTVRLDSHHTIKMFIFDPDTQRFIGGSKTWALNKGLVGIDRTSQARKFLERYYADDNDDDYIF
eukprot:354268_1